MRLHLSKLFLALALALPGLASAESDFTSGAGALTANARLDFRIVIPKILYLKVGTGSTAPFADNATVDLVDFDYTASPGAVGDSATTGATSGSPVAVQVVANASAGGAGSNVTLNVTTLGALQNAAADTISFTKITGTSDNANLAHPAAFVDGGASANVTVTPNIGTKVVNRTANWSYTYANDAIVPSGTYGGVNTNNSRVTYTATLP